MAKLPPKTVLIFSCFYQPFEGGAERYVKEITEGLKEKYNFLILTSRISLKLPRKEKKNGIEIWRLGLGFKFDKFLYPVLAPFKSFFIKKDLIHAVLESYAGLALLFYRLFDKKTPTLLTLQSGRVSMPQFLFKKIHQAPDKIQAISNALAKRARDFGAKNIEVVPNGIASDLFSQDFKTQKEKFRIITVSHLKKVKGLEYLIEAMPDILEKFPQAKLVLVGKGPEEENLKIKVASLNLKEKVEFKGALLHQEIPQQLVKSTVFVLPSLAEGLGIAILEAQAAGAPVVATGVDGILDIVKDGVSGILVPPKNSKEVSRAIIKIFSNPEFAQNLAENAKKNLEKYEWQEIAKKIDKIYQELL